MSGTTLRHTLLAALISLAATPFAHADEAALLTEARNVASAIPPKLLTMLTEEINRNGPDGAISVCREKAPQVAKETMEKTGWNIRRVSLKNRNPKAVPDAWEQAVLADFDKRAAAGEKPATLERGELVADTAGTGKIYRYMKALPTNELCLTCHGTPERIVPAVKTKLDELYPHDKATGYVPGEIRGAITLKKPL